MFRRYGNGLLLFCVLAFLAAIALSGHVERSIPRTAVSTFAQGNHHYIITDHARLNLNCATREELMELPLVGEDISDAILTLRSDVGSFASVEELLAVDGIGPATYEAIAPFLYVP